MAKKVQSGSENRNRVKPQVTPRCVALFERGITNSFEFLEATTTAIADIASARLGSTAGNAIFAGERNILKMLELQQKYGAPQSGTSSKVLQIGK
jgi:hypothetical protein